MNSVSQDVFLSDKPISISDLWQACVKSWQFIAASVICCITAGLLYLAISPVKYTTSMMIANAQDMSLQGTSQGTSSLLSQMAGIKAPGSEKFSQFQVMMTSYEVAQAIDRTQNFHSLLRYSTASDLQSALKRSVKIAKIDESTITVTATTTDANGTVSVLNAIYQNTENVLRAAASRAAEARIKYLNFQISATQNNTNRDALINILSNQLMQLAFSQAKTPYIAVILDPPVTPTRPITRLPLILNLTTMVGLMIGFGGAILARKNGIKLYDIHF